jgi:hypothetical protein
LQEVKDCLAHLFGIKAEDVATQYENPRGVVFQKRSNDQTIFIDNPAPKKTIAIIAVSPLNEGNGVCGTGKPIQYPNLQPGQAVIISGDVIQYYSHLSVGGGVGIILRLNRSIKEKKAEQTE